MWDVCLVGIYLTGVCAYRLVDMDLLGDMLDGMFRSDARTFHRRLGVLRCFRPENATGDALHMSTYKNCLLPFPPALCLHCRQANLLAQDVLSTTHPCSSHLM